MSTESKKNFFYPPILPTSLLKAARSLRNNMTDAEQMLWYCLRRKQLGGFRFRRQHPFEQFVLDFYCCEVKLALELDGGYHNEPDVKTRDSVRTEFLSARGIKVLRFWNNDVFSNLEGVLQKILDESLHRKKQLSTLSPKL